ncbi:hypothetical protein ACHAXT_005975 [Thalassiosira profunda]
MAPPSTAGGAAAPPSPPWQLRWKRPRFHRVALGVPLDSDGPDLGFQTQHDDDATPDDHDFGNDGEEDEYEFVGNLEQVGEGWTPVASAAATLTREEARAAVGELSRRGELLVRRRKTPQQEGDEGETGGDDGERGNEEPTPKNRNAASFQWAGRLISSAESAAGERDNTSAAKSIAAENETAAQSSLTSPSSWFKSITSPGNNNKTASKTTSGASGRPPRATSKSPTLFSTSRPNTPPPGKHSPQSPDQSPDDGGHDDDDSDRGDSPPATNDASTASSLLWEDRTLTSVSAEDAALLRRYGRQRRGEAGSLSEGGAGRASAADADGSGGRERGGACDGGAARRGNVQQWDDSGFDTAVLSVTSFATNPSSAIGGVAAASAGEVVVLELLSTQDPPLPSDRLDGEAGGGKQKRASASSSGSSLTSPRGGSAENDDENGSGSAGTQRTRHSDNGPTNPALGEDDDEAEGKSHRTRLLARRVLHWPSSIRAGGDRGGCPSFVALGRAGTAASGREAAGGGVDDGGDDGGGEHRAADAWEAVAALNFLLGGAEAPPRPLPVPQRSPEAAAAAREKQGGSAEHSGNRGETPKGPQAAGPLSLCLVSSDGTVHLYSALRVLLGDGRGEYGPATKGGGLSSGLASFLLGATLFERVERGVAPLCRPRATVRLSQISAGAAGSSSKNEERNEDEDGGDCILGADDPPMWQRFLASPGTDDRTADRPGTSTGAPDAPFGDWASLSAFDAAVDPSSLPLRTLRHSHVLTGACVALDDDGGYLAVCGKGLRQTSGDARQGNNFALGGFVTFVSLKHGAEVRTVYLPFAPEKIQPVEWCGMQFVVLMGEEGSPRNETQTPHAGKWGSGAKGLRRRRPCVAAVRADCRDFPNLTGVAPAEAAAQSVGPAPWRSSSSLDEGGAVARPSRFQRVPVHLPSARESLGLLSSFLGEGPAHPIQSEVVAVSSVPSSPPGIVVSFRCHPATEQGVTCAVVVNHTLGPWEAGDGGRMSLSTLVRPGHRVALEAGSEASGEAGTAAPGARGPTLGKVWCTGGQGWSLVGVQGAPTSHFVCWDGATDDSHGPFILPLHQGTPATGRSFCLASGVLPLTTSAEVVPTAAGRRNDAASDLPASNLFDPNASFLRQDGAAEGGFPGFQPKRSFSIALKESIKMAAETEGRLDDIILNALDSISAPQNPSPKSRATVIRDRPRPKSLAMSHREKSRRILRQCSSWTQLDDSKSTHGIVQGQVIVATIRLGSHFQSLTLRTNIVANPISTPFHQVLSWLCQRRDYFTAASVALSLLDDADAVYELRGIPKTLDEGRSHHKGLLDGITPLEGDTAHGSGRSEMLTSLADMAVACLIKGGVSMSKTLEGFLARNTLYDAPRACLMLVGSTAAVMSKEPSPQPNSTTAGNIVDMISTADQPSEELLWPVRCLIKMAVVRNSLPSTILMLNATIPNELRWRAPKGRGLSSAPRPSLGLFLALVDIILESTESATRLLLNTTDEETGMPYWQSIEDDAKLALSLISIRGKLVMLLEPEVRSWILGRLKEEIESPVDPTRRSSGPLLPNEWLKEVVAGAFCNAECDIGLGWDALIRTGSGAKEDSAQPTEVGCYRQEMLGVKDLLIPRHSDGLDLDLAIASLLILARREQHWREGSRIATQTLLNSVCEMAGKKASNEPRFVFDVPTVMRQCALCENVQAAAFLVGGKNGLVLECADLVVSELDVTMKEAETAVFVGSLVDLRNFAARMHQGTPQEEPEFTPTQTHHHLAWLLEAHVLKALTYGEFESSRPDKVDPVFVARVCFRTWYCLTPPSALGSSANWLEAWLRRKLELTVGAKSPKRLACAALVRALLWADQAEELDSNDGDSEPLLATLLRFDARFLAELARSCCGLIEAVPPHAALEIVSSYAGQNLVSFGGEAPLLR